MAQSELETRQTPLSAMSRRVRPSFTLVLLPFSRGFGGCYGHLTVSSYHHLHQFHAYMVHQVPYEMSQRAYGLSAYCPCGRLIPRTPTRHSDAFKRVSDASDTRLLDIFTRCFLMNVSSSLSVHFSVIHFPFLTLLQSWMYMYI